MEKRDGRIVETPTEARQAEPGPSILLLLVVSVSLAVVVLGAIWFLFFVRDLAMAKHLGPAFRMACLRACLSG